MAHILIADDDELIADILAQALAAAGHPSSRATSAQAAWESMHARRPDLLLLDRDMPGTSRLELLAKLRGSPLFYDLPTIVLSAMRFGGRAEALRAGAQDFLRKPFETGDLVERVERALAPRGPSVNPLAATAEGHCDASIAHSASYWQEWLPQPRRS